MSTDPSPNDVRAFLEREAQLDDPDVREKRRMRMRLQGIVAQANMIDRPNWPFRILIGLVAFIGIISIAMLIYVLAAA